MHPEKSVARILSILFMAFVALVLTACGGGGGSSTADPTPGTLQLDATTYSVAEGVTMASASVTRTGGSDGAVSVDVVTTDGTATSGDYTGGSTTLNWADGDSTAKMITAAITDDAVVELSETFTISLSNASVASLGTNTSASVTITDDDSVTITGTVSAPNGTVAFNGPSITDRMLAFVFGEAANAVISDLVSPVPSVTVNVYEVDADGNLVSGTPVTTATTDGNGAYTLAAPLDAPASKYIIRAEGSTGDMDSRIVAASVDVDPLTDATSFLVAYAATDLTTVSLDEVVQIQDEVSGLIEEVDTSALTATELSTVLNAEAQNNEEVNNVVTSSAAPGLICGKVTKQTTVGLEKILVVVRDFGNWVTRAKAKTDANGDYCVNVPFGNYIVGAVNRTGDGLDADRSASEWYTAGGGATFQIDAEQVSVPDATQVDISFDLASGTRVLGTVTAHDGGSTEGIQVLIRDFDTLFPAASARVKADGTFRVNVKPGRYTVMARNKTVKPYASEYYNASGGTNVRGFADLIDTTGQAGRTLNFTVDAGYKLAGIVTEGGTAVTGERVSVNRSAGGAAVRLRTNKEGNYRIWLAPDTYDVRSYGQYSLAVDMTAMGASRGFTADVAKLPVTVEDSAGNPVSQAKVLIYGGTAGSTYIGNGVSASDGTLFVQTDTANIDHKVLVRIDSAEVYGATIYDGQTQRALGTSVDLTPGVTPTPITITLPDAGVLKVEVVDNTTDNNPQGNVPVQIRDGLAGSNQFVSLRTQGDGAVLFSLPGNTGSSKIYGRVRVNGGSGGNCDNVPIQNGMTTTVTFETGNPTACVVGAPM